MGGKLAVLPCARGTVASCVGPTVQSAGEALSFGSPVRRAPAPQDRGGHITVASGFGVCSRQGESDAVLLRGAEICSGTEPLSSLPVFLLPFPLSLDLTPSETWESGHGTIGWEGWRGQAWGVAVAFSPHRTGTRVFLRAHPAGCQLRLPVHVKLTV